MVETKNNIAIEINDLSKNYHGMNKMALSSLNLKVKKGEIFGYLGPNGAGKSTTIRLLMNFIQPSSGRATILGLDVVKDSVAVKRKIGYLSGESAMYPKMTAKQYLSYMRDLHPVGDMKYTKELVKRLNVEMDKKIGELSRGNQQKVAIVQALMHKPEVIILDEPSSGLDPLMQEEFYKLLEEAKSRGACIFMSSHILGEVQRVCDRIGIIREGKLVAEQNLLNLASSGITIFDVTFKDRVDQKALKNIKGVQKVETNGSSATVHIQGDLSPLLAYLSKQNVSRLETKTMDLEELFLHYYQKGGGSK